MTEISTSLPARAERSNQPGFIDRLKKIAAGFIGVHSGQEQAARIVEQDREDRDRELGEQMFLTAYRSLAKKKSPPQEQ